MVGEIYQRGDWRELKSHSAAEMFPLMNEHQVKVMAEAMRLSGYDNTEPVILYGDAVLDGRNRLRMCEDAEVEPWFVDFTGSEEEAYQLVWRKNAGRRDLNESQKALVAARYRDRYEAEAKLRMVEGQEQGRESLGRADDGRFNRSVVDLRQTGKEQVEERWKGDKAAGEAMGVGESTVTRMRRIMRELPDYVAEIEAGKIPVNTVYYRFLHVPKAGKGDGSKNSAKRPKRAKPPHQLSLEGWETYIEGRLEAFLECAYALYQIREGRLFMEHHGSFPQYLRDRWGVAYAKGQEIMVGLDSMVFSQGKDIGNKL